MDTTLKELVDREAIRDLRTRYAHCLDSNDIDALDQVFSADAVVEVTVGKMAGIDAIKKGLQEAFALYDRDSRGRYPFMHAITNHWIALTGPDTAEGRCYLIDFETASKPDPNPLLLLGVYADAYERINGEWRIVRTKLEVVWPGSSDRASPPAGKDNGA